VPADSVEPEVLDGAVGGGARRSVGGDHVLGCLLRLRAHVAVVAPLGIDFPLPLQARPLAPEELALVPTFNPRHVLDQADQVRSGRRHGTSTVLVVESFDVPDQCVAGALEV
jgi:hypothetical protein